MMSKPEQSRARHGRRAALVGGGLSLALGAGLSVGMLAGANTPSTTDVNFVSLATPYKLFTNKAIKTTTPATVLGLGGATKVPSNATTIEIALTVSGSTAAGGTVTVAPAGNPSGGSGSVTWDGGESGQGNVATQIGTADDITFTDTGGPAQATATIIGYSTQVTDGDVSGLDGNTGQVLTDTGSGAAWQTPSGVPSFAQIGSIDQHLSDTGVTSVLSMALPAGNYWLNFTVDVQNLTNQLDDINCSMTSPTDGAIANQETDVNGAVSADMSMQGFAAGGETISVTCSHAAGTGTVELGLNNPPTLDALQVSSTSYVRLPG